MTSEARKTGSLCTGLYLYPRKDDRFCIFRRKLRRAVFDLRHRVFLLRVSLREIRREFCNFCRRSRILLATKRHYYTGWISVDLGPAGGMGANGHPISCTRTLGRIQDTQHFLQSNLEATPVDTDWFLVGWDKGVEWGACHPHLCISDSCKRYVVLAPYRDSIPSSRP